MNPCTDPNETLAGYGIFSSSSGFHAWANGQEISEWFHQKTEAPVPARCGGWGHPWHDKGPWPCGLKGPGCSP
jgi:hypothetical protein